MTRRKSEETRAPRKHGGGYASAMPADFAEIAHLSNRDLMARFGVSESSLTTWRRRVGKGKTHGGRPPRPVPDDFREVAPGKSSRSLAAHYGIAAVVISRWRDECGIPPFERQKMGATFRKRNLPVPDDLAERAAEMGFVQLCVHYARNGKTVRRWLNETGISPVLRRHKAMVRPVRRVPAIRKAKPTPGYVALPQPSRISLRKSGREEDAAQHLRRYFIGVFHCDEDGRAKQDGTHWRCGNAVLTGAELIERAVRKGFDPEAWKRLAA
jgi:transposase